MFSLAGGARPGTNAERKFFDDVATGAARLAARKEAIDFDQRTTVPFRFVAELADEFRPASIRDCTREAPILDHSTDVQILDDNRLVFANESSAELVGIVPASIGDSGVQAGKLQARLVAISEILSSCAPGGARECVCAQVL